MRIATTRLALLGKVMLPVMLLEVLSFLWLSNYLVSF